MSGAWAKPSIDPAAHFFADRVDALAARHALSMVSVCGKTFRERTRVTVLKEVPPLCPECLKSAPSQREEKAVPTGVGSGADSKCWGCKGSGRDQGSRGQPVTCVVCGGSGVERA